MEQGCRQNRGGDGDPMKLKGCDSLQAQPEKETKALTSLLELESRLVQWDDPIDAQLRGINTKLLRLGLLNGQCLCLG
jgi:hypothetical protein